MVVLRSVLRAIHRTSDPAVHRPLFNVQHIYAGVGERCLWLLHPRTVRARQSGHWAEADAREHRQRRGTQPTRSYGVFSEPWPPSCEVPNPKTPENPRPK